MSNQYHPDTLRHWIAKSYGRRNVYLTTQGVKRDRRDLVQRNREFIRDCIQQIREQEKV